MPLPVPIPPSPRRVGGAAGRLRRARHRLAPRARSCARSTRSARSPCSPTAARCPTTSSSACPMHRVPDGGGGVGPDASTAGSRSTRSRSRPRSPTCTRSATSPASARRRPACSPRARPSVVADAIIARARDGDADVDLRRARHLLPRVRRRRGRPGRRHLRRRPGAGRHARRAVADDRRRQGRVRHEPHPALVRGGVVDDLTLRRRRGRRPRCPRRTAAATCPC